MYCISTTSKLSWETDLRSNLLNLDCDLLLQHSRIFLDITYKLTWCAFGLTPGILLRFAPSPFFNSLLFLKLAKLATSSMMPQSLPSFFISLSETSHLDPKLEALSVRVSLVCNRASTRCWIRSGVLNASRLITDLQVSPKQHGAQILSWAMTKSCGRPDYVSWSALWAYCWQHTKTERRSEEFALSWTPLSHGSRGSERSLLQNKSGTDLRVKRRILNHAIDIDREVILDHERLHISPFVLFALSHHLNQASANVFSITHAGRISEI